jgi:hypothetical protein
MVTPKGSNCQEGVQPGNSGSDAVYQRTFGPLNSNPTAVLARSLGRFYLFSS